MSCIKTYRLLAVFALCSSCGERITVSDVDSLGLRYKVKSVNESFYMAYSSFDSIVLRKKIYQYKYQFYNDCKYKSIEKSFYFGKFPSDSINDLTVNASKRDSVEQCFPFAFKEPGYYFVKYKYVSDSLITLDFFDRQGNLQKYINRKYADNRLLYEEKYSDSGSLISKSKFRYDSKNKLLNKTVFYDNGYRETNYAYSAGTKLETGDEFDYCYKFDINGRISNKKAYKGIASVSETSFYYNDYGDVTATYETDRKGIIRKILYDYTYDSNNNWILCVEYNDTGNIFVRKREITYYN